ncbi:MAG: ankyrin repeat domain-containing protein [Mucilaginibacter sp.]
MIRIILFITVLSSCTNGNNSLDKNQILGSDYRVFENTPVWTLTKAVEKGDTIFIADFLKSHKQLVDYRDPTFGQTLLMLAVYNRNYTSVRSLLKLGADPNKQSLKYRKSALMDAASLGGGGKFQPYADSRFLKLLLKYGGNPNDMQDGDSMPKGSKNYATALEFACLSSNSEYVRILVDAGANVNLVSRNGFSALYASVVGSNPDIVLYLLKQGADYKRPLLTNIRGEKKYILDVIDNMWDYDKDSYEFKEESLIKAFIKAQSLK